MENSKIINKIVAMQPELMSFAFKLTANQDSANDLVQDSILKALDNTQKFIRQENFKGWMYTIMRNLFINNYRRSVRELNFLDSNFTDYAQIQVAKDDDKFEETYDLKLLYRIINKLPDDTKQPFMMFVSGLKYKEIAEKNGLAHRNNQKPFALCPKETSKGFERFLVRNSRTKDSHLIIIDF